MATSRLLWTVAFYAALTLAGGIGIIVRDRPLLGSGGLAGPVLLGVLGAALAVALSRLARRLTAWAVFLESELGHIVGGATPAQAIVLALASGVGEETFFRGALQPEIGLVATTVIFALLHIGPDVRFLGWSAFAAAMGVMLGCLYEATGGLLAPMTAHVLINAINLMGLRDPTGLADGPFDIPPLPGDDVAAGRFSSGPDPADPDPG